MSRVQLALNVDDLDEAITFYSKLFKYRTGQGQRGLRQLLRRRAATETGAVKNPGKGGTINRLGVEVESSERVHDEIARLTGDGLFTDEEIGTRVFATQDKVWVDRTGRGEVEGTPCSRTPTRSAPPQAAGGHRRR